MKIYKAELIMFLDYDYTSKSKYGCKFSFELEKEEYKKEEKYNHYTKGEGWVNYRIPINMEIMPTAVGLYKVVQGFEKELNEEELESLKREMTLKLIEQLNKDKEDYLRKYDNKIQILNEIINE